MADNRNVYSDVDEFGNLAHEIGCYGPLSFSEANSYRILRECIDKHLVCFEDDVAEVAIWCEAVERTARERNAAYEVIFRMKRGGAIGQEGTCMFCREEKEIYPALSSLCRECIIEVALEMERLREQTSPPSPKEWAINPLSIYEEILQGKEVKIVGEDGGLAIAWLRRIQRGEQKVVQRADADGTSLPNVPLHGIEQLKEWCAAQRRHGSETSG